MARILVAEADLLYREMVQFMLERDGHQVVAVESGRQCLGRLEQDAAFDLVVADLFLPNCDGGELVAGIRRRDAAIAIIGIASGATGVAPPMATALGVGAVLAKPFTAEELSQVAAAFLGRKARGSQR